MKLPKYDSKEITVEDRRKPATLGERVSEFLESLKTDGYVQQKYHAYQEKKNEKTRQANFEKWNRPNGPKPKPMDPKQVRYMDSVAEGILANGKAKIDRELRQEFMAQHRRTPKNEAEFQSWLRRERGDYLRWGQMAQKR